MADLDIKLQENGDRGRYFTKLADGAEAEMTFLRSGPVIAIDHTYVPPHHEGQGVAMALLQRAIADARAQNYKIRPRCSYVVAQFARHRTEWADVLAG